MAQTESIADLLPTWQEIHDGARRPFWLRGCGLVWLGLWSNCFKFKPFLGFEVVSSGRDMQE